MAEEEVREFHMRRTVQDIVHLEREGQFMKESGGPLEAQSGPG